MDRYTSVIRVTFKNTEGLIPVAVADAMNLRYDDELTEAQARQLVTKAADFNVQIHPKSWRVIPKKGAADVSKR